MASSDQPVPNFTGTIQQSFLIEPLGGPQQPISYLDRFPDELYNKAPESHFTRFIYTLLGPAGIGWLRKNYLEARLVLEDYGLNINDLDQFYGDPFKFGRVIDEQFADDPSGLLTKAQWEEIKSKDAQYRSRVIDFLGGARLGNTPAGMHLIARSGLGYENEIFENYKYLYDIHSDNPAGLPYMGVTDSTEEMIVMPRAETPRSAEQTIVINGNPNAGNFSLIFNGIQSGPIVWDAIASHSSPALVGGVYQDVQSALEAIETIGVDQVHVTGGPAPLNPIVVDFTGSLSNMTVPDFMTVNSLTGDPTAEIVITQNISAVESVDATVSITDLDTYNLYSALFRIKPMTTIPTITPGPGTTSRQQWSNVIATSKYIEVVRFVTGQPSVNWTLDRLHWIEKGIEHQAPRTPSDLQFHYQGLHNITGIVAYTDAALSNSNYMSAGPPISSISEHIGRFSPPEIVAVPFLAQFQDDTKTFSGDMAQADYPEPLVVTAQNDDISGKTVQYIDGVYPADYTTLQGIPPIQYMDEHFWASLERPSGDEYLEIDLGTVQAVNFLAMEVSAKPINIEISYDLLDQAPARTFRTVTPVAGSSYPDFIIYTPEEQSPWYYAEYNFTNAKGDIPFTRFIRIKFSRRTSTAAPFLFDLSRNIQNPWSIDVKNLRLGRNLS